MALSTGTDDNIIYRGFDASFRFDFTDALAEDVDLVGITALFTLKLDRKADDTTATLKHDEIISSDDLDPDNSKLLIISFDAEAMQAVSEGTYYFDLKLFNPDGTGLIYVPYTEQLVIDDVTDRIAIS